MIISGKNNISGLLDEEIQIQPAGIDLTVGKIEMFKGSGTIDFDNSTRKIAEGMDYTDERLPGGRAYRVTYNEVIKVPDDVVGLIYPRSSLLRNGGHLVSAVWDPGYKGRGQGLLQVLNPHGLVLKKDARIGQIIFIRLEDQPNEGYGGKFQGENM